MSLNPAKFEIYAVGGYVRDRLLGRDPKDHDFVVVGATAEDMVAAGFEPIEASFPVFLHPKTRDEFALARKERKVGVGYYGFEVFFNPTVTIEDDLYRRDLTVNAMARRVISWNELGHAKLSDDIVDPFGGQQDLKDGILRHVSEAFAEDPVRVLRTARFAARYNFTVHPATFTLMGTVAHELNDVPQERIWAEFEKGLMEKHAHRMFSVLQRCGAFEERAMRPYKEFAPEVLIGISEDAPLYARFAASCHGMQCIDFDVCRIPTDIARVTKAFAKHRSTLAVYTIINNRDRLTLLEEMRALSDGSLIHKCLEALAVMMGVQYTQLITDAIARDIASIRTVDAKAIADQCRPGSGSEIRHRLFEARVAAMELHK